MTRTSRLPGNAAWVARAALHGAILLGLWLGSGAPLAAAEPVSVLVLEEEDPWRPAFMAFIHGFRQCLASNLASPVIVYTENLDLARFDSPGYRTQIQQWLRIKYLHRRLDAVVASGAVATGWTLQMKRELWPEAPLVLLGGRAANRTLGEEKNVHLVSLELDIRGTIELALHARPDTRRLLLLGVNQPAYVGLEQQVMDDTTAAANARGLEVLTLPELTLAEYKQRVANLPPDTVIIYIGIWKDASGTIRVPRDVLRELSRVSNAPIFGLIDTHLGYGIVGGSCLHMSQAGELVGRNVARLLGPNPSREQASVASLDRRIMIDWTEWTRFGLKPDRIPPGADVQFRTPALWETHSDAVVLILATLVLQSIFIVALFLQNGRRRRAELHLRESEERMSLAVQAANLVLWQWDAEHGNSPPIHECKSVCGVIRAPDHLERCARYACDACPLVKMAVERITPQKPMFEVGEFLHGQSGEPRWAESRGRGYFDPQGKLIRLVGVTVDVTDRKRTEASLQEFRDQLAHSGRVTLMGQLASSLAHELNQPLGAILRNAETAEILLQAGRPPLEEIRSIVRDIKADNERAAAVIDNMRTFLKRQSLEKKPLDLPNLLREVTFLVQSDAASRHTQIRLHIPGTLPKVMGDRIHLQQVLLNLLMNGLDALNSTPGVGRSIRVSAKVMAPLGTSPAGSGFSERPRVRVEVSDSGPGFPAEARDKIFEPFFTTKPNGMGLGLAISRTLIEAHGGQIDAENNPEGGATFWFELPAIETL